MKIVYLFTVILLLNSCSDTSISPNDSPIMGHVDIKLNDIEQEAYLTVDIHESAGDGSDTVLVFGVYFNNYPKYDQLILGFAELRPLFEKQKVYRDKNPCGKSCLPSGNFNVYGSYDYGVDKYSVDEKAGESWFHIREYDEEENIIKGSFRYFLFGRMMMIGPILSLKR